MSLFDNLQEDVYKRLAAGHPAQKFKIPQAEPQDLFRTIGQAAPAGLFSAAATPIAESVQPTPEQEADPSEITEPLDRTIPNGFSIHNQDLIGRFPEGSDIDTILKKGYSIAMDEAGNIGGIVTPSAHLISPEEALKQEPVETLLTNAGYIPSEENIDRFLRQNDDLTKEPKDFIYNGLNPIESDVLLKSKKDIVFETAMQTPVMQVLSGMKTPLDIIGEGLKRYEALKTSIIMNMPLNPIKTLVEGAKSVAGTAETEFPDAALRNSIKPELGDIFRKMGLSEPSAAGAGLVLDILTDGVLFGMAGKGSKAFLQSKKIGDESAYDYVMKRWNKFKSAANEKGITDALKGKRTFDIDAAPEFIQQQRKILSKPNLVLEDATNSMRNLDRFIISETPKNPEILKMVTEAWEGGSEALAKLPTHIQTTLRAAHNSIGNLSSDLADELKRVLAEMPESVTAFQKSAGIIGGKQIPIEQLIDIIIKNEGSYAKRTYQLFRDQFYKPSEELFAKAKRGLISEFNVTENEASEILNMALRDREVILPSKSGLQKVKVNKASFIARQPIPKYMREFMGEITDPRYTILETQKSLADSLSRFKFFRLIEESGLTTPEATKNFSVPIKGGDSLSWGLIKGKYTSPEVDYMLRAMEASRSINDDILTKSMQYIKGLKTVLNPKTHGHNIAGNSFLFAGLADITPFDPTNFKHYKKAAEILTAARLTAKGNVKASKDLYRLYRQALEDGVIGTELPQAEQIKFIDDLLKNPFHKRTSNAITGGLKTAVKEAAYWYSAEDQVFKLTAYLKNLSKGMTREAATAEMYKWMPNYAEVSRLAQHARTSPLGLLMLNPFLSFRSEAHRILLNALKGSPAQKTWMGAYFAGRTAFNYAVLSSMGYGMKDIKEYFMSRPEVMSEVLLNPLDPSGQTDLNIKYIDPVNTEGLFAPLMAYSGATGVHPLDYLLDFTMFSPEFGYSNLLTTSLEGFVTGKGKYGEDLSASDRLKSIVQGIGPTSFTIDLPKILDTESEGSEKLRSVFRFLGIDLEKRNPEWIKNQVKERLMQKVNSGEDLTATLNAVRAIGFNPERMMKGVQKTIGNATKKNSKKQTSERRAIDIALSQFGL